MSELRRDPIIGRWVIISAERGRRPSEFQKRQDDNAGKPCPFCTGNEKLTPSEILAYGQPGRHKDGPGWWIRVIPNKYPALAIEGSLNRQAEGMYDKMNGLGAHEVIIETPDHTKSLAELTEKHIEDVIWVYRDRIMDLKKDIRLEYALIFKNHGAAAGATLSHSHSQLIATPVVPRRVREEVNGAKGYYDYKERCVFCDIIKQELSLNIRIVAENDDFVVMTPFASRFPFEVWILPKVHDSDFENIQKHSAVNLASILKSTLLKFKNVLENPAYNFVLHNTPLREHNLPHYHWHLELIPKLTDVAGFEWGSGFYINTTPPEEAAKFLRESD
jgi:UDPglucose--hexose-1-phosphate uridylyltransferase